MGFRFPAPARSCESRFHSLHDLPIDFFTREPPSANALGGSIADIIRCSILSEPERPLLSMTARCRQERRQLVHPPYPQLPESRIPIPTHPQPAVTIK